LTTPPDSLASVVPTGKYQLLRGSGQSNLFAHAYRLSHPLGEWTVETCRGASTPAAAVQFDYSHHGARISDIERLKGKSGWLTLIRVVVTAFDTNETLLFSAQSDDGQLLDQEACEKLMSIQATKKPGPAPENPPECLPANAERRVQAAIAEALEANQRLFNEEREKLEMWADDKLLAAEDALRNTKARISQLKRDARKATSLQEQSTIQQELSQLERQQRKQRQEIFAVEDEIIAKRDVLIESLQKRMQEKTEKDTLFTIRWSVA
jgi:hypothetical protein